MHFDKRYNIATDTNMTTRSYTYIKERRFKQIVIITCIVITESHVLERCCMAASFSAGRSLCTQ